ncbi:MAG: hypothetical protein HN704_07325 [Bacteroidetes bacterium]|jgi:hypothetical protein|nr:hypothetical protein [Bacteroidota bacterium]MBT6687639.1 hypothetical protein [Bacteroidota bacterium]MBT7144772.1 hypothetical protein [Bacteroidota bacterium]MBT7491399.1 hypothetical protein [Bacteroidota bacterium]
MKKNLLIFIFFTILNFSFAQGEINKEQKYGYRNINSYGLYINSNGFGVGYQFEKRINRLNQYLFECDINWLKHPKETQSSNPLFSNPKQFVFGKLNTFYNVRLGIGKQKEVFSKFDKGGISIKYFYTAGISLGLLKPVYYEILEPIPGEYFRYTVRTDKFNIAENHTIYDIYSKSSFLKGFDELSLYPGFYAKFGTSFEYSDNNKFSQAIEAGIAIDAFFDRIEIMAIENNNRIFVSLFLSYRFGKVVKKEWDK